MNITLKEEDIRTALINHLSKMISETTGQTVQLKDSDKINLYFKYNVPYEGLTDIGRSIDAVEIVIDTE